MKKIFIQGFILIFSLVILIFVLNKIDWMHIIQPEKISSKTDEKLGVLIKSSFDLQFVEIEDEIVKKPIETLLSSLDECNDMNTENIRIIIYQNSEVNAFALPGNQIVLNSGLIQACASETELQGVIAHELAHIQMNHIQKKLIQNFGISVLLNVTVGNKAAEILSEMTHMLSTTAFDRKMEKEADFHAVTYLNNCGIDARPFTDLLLRITSESQLFSNSFSWISTHPDSQERIDYVVLHQKNKKFEYKNILTDEQWALIQENLAGK
jgi:beta-barrel assembly-enhancing protease